MAEEDEQRQEKLSRCDVAYYKNAEPIAERLFAFIQANKAAIKFSGRQIAIPVSTKLARFTSWVLGQAFDHLRRLRLPPFFRYYFPDPSCPPFTTNLSL